jgi:hypothetical protein
VAAAGAAGGALRVSPQLPQLQQHHQGQQQQQQHHQGQQGQQRLELQLVPFAGRPGPPALKQWKLGLPSSALSAPESQRQCTQSTKAVM